MLDADLTSLALQAALWLDTIETQQSRRNKEDDLKDGLNVNDSDSSKVGGYDDDYNEAAITESGQEGEWVEMIEAIRSLPWVDLPPMKRLSDAIDLLTLLGALEASPLSDEGVRGDTDDGDDGGDEDSLDSFRLEDNGEYSNDYNGDNDDSHDNGNNDVPQPVITRWRRVTPHGRRLSSLPLHPRLAHMVTTAVDLDYDVHDVNIHSSDDSDISSSSSSSSSSLAVEACTLAALLQERDPMPQGSGTDLRQRLDALEQYKAQTNLDQSRGRSSTGSNAYSGVNGARFAAVAAAEVQLLSALKTIKPYIDSPVAGEGLALRAAAADATAAAAAAVIGRTEGTNLGDCTGALLALAYPDRVAQRKSSGGGSAGSGGKVPWKGKSSSSSSGSRGGGGSRFTMAVGAGAVFADPHDPLNAADWIVVRDSFLINPRRSSLTQPNNPYRGVSLLRLSNSYS